MDTHNNQTSTTTTSTTRKLSTTRNDNNNNTEHDNSSTKAGYKEYDGLVAKEVTTTAAAAIAAETAVTTTSSMSSNRRKRRWGTSAITNDDNDHVVDTDKRKNDDNGTTTTVASQISSTNSLNLPAAVGSNGVVTSTTTTAASPTIDSNRARILALQQSVTARLAAAKKGNVSVNTRSGTVSVSTATPVVAAVPISNPNKKAKVYELDLTITGPSYKDDDKNESSTGKTVTQSTNTTTTIASTSTSTSLRRKQRWGTAVNATSQQPLNPYLAHRSDLDNQTTMTSSTASSKALPTKVTSTSLETTDNTDKTDDLVDNDDTATDPRLLRVSKQRVKNKAFHFLEPGVWSQRADKVRMNQTKIFESGFLTGRKKGHTVTAASMAGIYGSGGGGGADYNIDDDDIINTDSSSLPPRSDANPDPNHVISMPLVMEWWDMELLPSKLRKQVAAVEQEKDRNANLKLQPKKGKQKKKGNSDDDDVDADDNIQGTNIDDTQVDATNSINPRQTLTDTKMDDNNILPCDDDLENGEWMGTRATQELRQLCYDRASLSNSKTSELIQHIVPIQPKVTIPPGSLKNDTTGSTMTVPAGTGASAANKEIVLHLTKKELKRQRKLQRREKHRETQDLQAAGLLPTPEPRLTLQNFFQVLGDTAVTDPSQIERIVQEQIQARKQKHLERNAANKLTSEQRREKKVTKLNEADVNATISQQTTVALFYVIDVTHPYHRAKLEKNAQQLNITGGVVEFRTNTAGMSAIIAEGNPRSIQRFIRLLTIRMKWNQPPPPPSTDSKNYQENNEHGTGGGGDDTEQKQHEFNPNNRCELIWKGLVAKRNFYGFVFQDCTTSTQARKVLKARGVEHYWDRIEEYHRSIISGGGTQFKLYTPNNEDDDDDDDASSMDDDDEDDDDNNNHSIIKEDVRKGIVVPMDES